MIQLQEKSRELEGKRKELDGRIEAMKTAPDNERAAFRSEELPRRQSEIKSLFDNIQGDAEMVAYQERNRAEMKAANEPNRMDMFGGGGDQREEFKSIGQRFTESDAYQRRGSNTMTSPIQLALEGADIKSWQDGTQDMAIKATMTTGAGFAPFIPRSGRLVEIAQLPPVIADLIPQDQTNVPGDAYMEETTYTNNADLVAEGGTKPEAALAFTERRVTMAKIAVTLPVTDEQLADVPILRGLIDNRLGLMVRQKEDYYLLQNTSVNGWDGFLQKAGVQNYDLSGGLVPIPTAVLSLITSIQNSPGFANVTGLVMNPTDWFSYVTYQIATGAYLVGAVNDTPIKTMWGIPIVVTNRIPQGTILLGDFRMFSQILRRQGLSIDVGWANDDFLKNLQRIRAEERLVLEIFRANAFGTVTGIAAP